jgi:ABC-2 type transport system ATP-binding protein
MTTSPPALSLHGLTKHYGEAVGIGDLTMSVTRGEVHGFLGRNGAGKTTTMKCLMGLLRWDAGKAELFGEPYLPSDIRLRRRIGFSSELPSYPAHLTGRETIEIFGRIRGLDTKSARAEAKRTLENVMLEDAADRKVGKYSRGMQAKLGLAVALLDDPDLLLLDEPTAGLDPVASAEVRTMFQGLAAQGTSILLSSHQLAEVQEVCNRITVIDQGHKVVEGTVTELIQKVQGGITYRAEFDHLPEALLEDMRHLDGVKSVLRLDGVPKPSIQLLLDKDWDMREAIARLAIKHGAVMISCARVEASLDKLFLALVQG